MGSLNCDLCDLGISRIERGRESEFPPTEGSGLQTPPTRDIPIPTKDITAIKDRGYKPLPQEIYPFPQKI